MPRATCRCGHDLPIPADPTERVVCGNCGARVRIRTKRAPSDLAAGDGFIRFFCPCGRRLKVDGAAPPPHGKCPDCGVIVPVPATSLATARPPGHPEAPTEEMATSDRDAIERWAAEHKKAKAAKLPPPPAPTPQPDEAEFGTTPTMAFTLPPSDRVEVGMRICGQCGQPLRLGAESCRECGAAAPKR